MLYTVQIPNLLGGVSQQPADVRFPNQLESADNVYPSQIDGLTKRFPSEHKARVLDGQADSSYIHVIDRDSTEQYAAVFSNKNLKVFDLEGTEYPVYADASGTAADFDYLDTTVGNGNQLAGAENLIPGAGTDWGQTIGIDFAGTGIEAGTNSPFTFGEANVIKVKTTPSGRAYIYQEEGLFPAIGSPPTHFSCFFRANNFDEVLLGWEDGAATVRAAAQFNLTTGVESNISQGIDAKITPVEAEESGWYCCRVSLDMSLATAGIQALAGNARYFYIEIPYVSGDETIYAFGAYGRDGGDPDSPYAKTDTIRAVTINDYTLVTNGARITQQSGETSPTGYDTATYGDEAYVYVKRGQYKTNYKLRYELSDDVSPTELEQRTWDGVDPSIGSPGFETTTIKTDSIAKQFLLGTPDLDGNNFRADQGTGSETANPNGTIDGVGLNTDASLTNDAQGSVVRMRTSDPTVSFSKLEVTDSQADRAMSSVHNVVEFADDLPGICGDGYVVRVANATEQAEDDYYLQFVSNEGADTFSEGHWEEAGKPGQFYKFLASSMPHQLVRRQDDQAGTATGKAFQIFFTWEQVDWSGRIVGDSDSNPWPTFLGRPIKSIFFWKGRLGFLSDESVILSEVNNFFNFFRTSVISLVDSDPVDVLASHTRVAKLHDAVAYQGNLILFSDQDQFVLRGTPLSPTTAAIERITAYDNFKDVEVTATGRSVYFGYKRGDYSGVYELYQIGDTGLYRADDVTEHVPKFIRGKVESIVASSLEDVVAVKASRVPADFQSFSDSTLSEDRKYLYIYKYAWSGNEKSQSSWVRWVFDIDTEIQSMKWLDNTLLMTVQRSDGLFFETITVEDTPVDVDSDVKMRLDRRVDEASTELTSVTYDSVTDTTAILLNFELYDTPNVRVISRESKGGGQVTNPGADYTITSIDVGTQDVTTITVEGDITSEVFYLGYVFEMSFEFSTPYLRERTSTGGLGTIIDGRYQLHYGRISFDKSAYFDVEVTPPGRDTDVNNFLFTDFSEDLLLDEVRYPSGEFVFPIFTRNTGLQIVVKSHNQYPFTAKRAEWEATYENRGRRYRV